MDRLTEFWGRLHAEWLPTFCGARGYLAKSFRANKAVSERDAADFLRAMSFITVNSRGEFTMPRSKAKEVIFWDGKFADPGVRMTLWIEPVVTIAAIARLHLDYGWPIESLGMQSSGWEFDLTAFAPSDCGSEYIAGEVKATNRGVDTLLTGLTRCCTQGDHDCRAEKPARMNAHKKWNGLRQRTPRIFWALGPNNDSRTYRAAYNDDETITLERVSEDALRYPFA